MKFFLHMHLQYFINFNAPLFTQNKMQVHILLPIMIQYYQDHEIQIKYR